MASVIIGIHGLGNKPKKATLEKWWYSAMLEGLKKHQKTTNLEAFELVYWADLLYDRPLLPSVVDRNDPYFLDERYEAASPRQHQEESPLRQKVLDFIEDQLDKLFLNDDLSVNYSGISDYIIHAYFRDLEAYYSAVASDGPGRMSSVQSAIRERLAAAIRAHRGKKIMIIAHSMGSIIAFDVLTFLVNDVEIDALVTIGSPLGFPVIQGKIVAEWRAKKLVSPKLQTPACIKGHWFNLADLKDKIALIYDLSENFFSNDNGVMAQDDVVHNDFQSNGHANPHKSYGYLRTKECAAILAAFSSRESIWHRLSTGFSRFWNFQRLQTPAR
jgi:pimeloyl-ACP methyl ester carboxylesterase